MVDDDAATLAVGARSRELGQQALAARGKLGPEKSLNVEIAGLYWHFVDVVWIVIFPLIYLIP